MPHPAIFLAGPIGVGKTTLGRALAEALGGAQVEGDDFQLADRPWYAASLHVARSILQAATETSARGPVVVSYPLRCIDYLFLSRRLAAQEVPAVFVNLAMPAELILSDKRGRTFTPWERARIGEMIALGYDRQPWADLHFEPADAPVEENLARLVVALAPLGVSAVRRAGREHGIDSSAWLDPGQG